MRYTVKGGIEIRSENAAKPSSQASKYTIAFLNSLAPCERALDYGCGKARYVPHIKRKADVLYLVDSEIQLTRTQSVHGVQTSISEYYRRSNAIHVLRAGQTDDLHTEVDRVYCLNVLSAIPSYKERSLVLSESHRLLRSGGELVVSVQYRNSDFARMAALPNAQPYLDGYLVNSLRGCSFYGLITPKRLKRQLARNGYMVERAELSDGTVFVLARKRRTTQSAISPLELRRAA